MERCESVFSRTNSEHNILESKLWPGHLCQHPARQAQGAKMLQKDFSPQFLPLPGVADGTYWTWLLVSLGHLLIGRGLAVLAATPSVQILWADQKATKTRNSVRSRRVFAQCIEGMKLQFILPKRKYIIF